MFFLFTSWTISMRKNDPGSKCEANFRKLALSTMRDVSALPSRVPKWILGASAKRPSVGRSRFLGWEDVWTVGSLLQDGYMFNKKLYIYLWQSSGVFWSTLQGRVDNYPLSQTRRRRIKLQVWLIPSVISGLFHVASFLGVPIPKEKKGFHIWQEKCGVCRSWVVDFHTKLIPTPPWPLWETCTLVCVCWPANAVPLVFSCFLLKTLVVSLCFPSLFPDSKRMRSYCPCTNVHD